MESEQNRPASSVSRGSFIFNPTKKTSSILSGTTRKLPKEENKHTLKREQVFAECWEAVERQINDIISSQHEKVFNDLVHFIHQSHKTLATLHATYDKKPGKEGKSLPPRLEVSTAVLLTGVNMPDHDELFACLEEKFHQDCSPYVVLLKAKDCNAGMKPTMKRILLQLMKIHQEQVGKGFNNSLRSKVIT